MFWAVLSEMNREGLHKELGHLQTDPVSRAIARHIGVDLSPDSLTALNRRGIAIIVYGAPNTGKILHFYYCNIIDHLKIIKEK